ncbi:hypothetical protein CASFOL_018262 [Castilleja foliolosa]|uniref:Regulator of Vps4 activity in the MVB pathway protein n=1 Tax=Castilleja foliolosa TaxID=1961234 RepID=A0ABD3D7L8_9LAMI
MGKKLDALIGRSSKTARKLNMLIKLAISRINILKNHQIVRCSQSESDVIELLHLGYQERAIIRVEQVIKEQNTLDAFVLIENYCRFLVEKTEMVKNNRECPDELKETVSTLIFAASRCGDFPELHEIRVLFTSMFGKEFAKSSVELRNNCQVYPKMIQRFSTQQPSLESRRNFLRQIAKHNGIDFQLDDEAFDESNTLVEAREVKAIKEEDNSTKAECSESIKARNYVDAETAAQEAFDSAAYTARAAVELARVESFDDDDDDGSGDHSGSP